MNTKSLSGLGFSLALCFSTAALRAQLPVALQVDIAHPGRAMPADFCGLSYEIKMVLPNATTGKHYFSPGNEPLISTFKTLGVKHLRVGGNTAERVTVAIPGTSDIDSLFAFARAAGVKVIYTVRMEGNTTVAAAGIAASGSICFCNTASATLRAWLRKVRRLSASQRSKLGSIPSRHWLTAAAGRRSRSGATACSACICCG